jgi:hypothetical protein
MDQALAAQEPYRTIAERFDTSPAALHRHKGHTGVPAPPAAPPGQVPALVDAAQRVHVSACQTRGLTRALRSTHEPALLARLEDLANLLLEVTSLLVAITRAPRE